LDAAYTGVAAKCDVIWYDPAAGATSPDTVYAPPVIVTVDGITIGAVAVNVTVLLTSVTPVVVSFKTPVTLYVEPCGRLAGVRESVSEVAWGVVE
jgi:hypothetical protein